MLVQEECVEVHALKQRGWSISAIARHLGRDRKTVRAYLLGGHGRLWRPEREWSGFWRKQRRSAPLGVEGGSVNSR